MRKGILSVVFAASIICLPASSFGWGKTGHEMVGALAFHFLDDTTRMKVQKYLGNLSFKEAANWMDDERSNSYYNYMRTWHYIDFAKGQEYQPSPERNILTIMHSALVELQHIETLKSRQIKRDLLLLFHLVGDLHQPLHVGYPEDKGGNTIQVSSANVSGNLHSVWDTQILEYKGITMEDCIKLYETLSPAEIESIKKINELKWLKQSRSQLDFAYSFKDGYLDKSYIDSGAVIIRKQLLMAGMRLAAVLTNTFKNFKVKNIDKPIDEPFTMDTTKATIVYKNLAPGLALNYGPAIKLICALNANIQRPDIMKKEDEIFFS